MPVMATIQLDELRAFVSVVRGGSFTAAATALGTQKAHVSRVVSRLEDRLRVRLLQRTTRAMSVTEAGRELFERAIGILGALDDTENALQRLHRRPSGVLKITCGVDFGPLAVNRWVTAYLRANPEVNVEVELTNRIVDVVHEGFDIAIRVGSLTDSTLSARKLGELRYGLFAAAAYLAGRPPVVAPGDLANHDIIFFAPGPPPADRRWRLVHGTAQTDIPIMPRIVVSSTFTAADVALDGQGIAMLSRLQADPLLESGALIEVLPGWGRAPVPVHAVFASTRYLAPKVRSFVDLARAMFGK